MYIVIFKFFITISHLLFLALKISEILTFPHNYYSIKAVSQRRRMKARNQILLFYFFRRALLDTLFRMTCHQSPLLPCAALKTHTCCVFMTKTTTTHGRISLSVANLLKLLCNKFQPKPLTLAFEPPKKRHIFVICR